MYMENINEIHCCCWIKLIKNILIIIIFSKQKYEERITKNWFKNYCISLAISFIMKFVNIFVE